jgi:hypothetical protein
LDNLAQAADALEPLLQRWIRLAQPKKSLREWGCTAKNWIGFLA